MANIEYIEFLGENNRPKLKFCGEHVVLNAMCKIMRAENMEIGDYSRILDFSFIDAGKLLRIGKHTLITWHCVIEGGAQTFIGNRVFMGPGSKLLTSTYELNGYYANEFLPKETRSTKYGDITLCDDAYIGAGSIIMPGVTVGEGAVVGANSLVDRNLKPWGIYFGSPAKLVGMREQPTEERKRIIDAMAWDKMY